MPSIVIPEIQQPRIETAVTYTDLTMDVEVNNLATDDNLFKPENSSDISVSVDEQAIKNSLVNIFNTIPGQKVLNPEFGLDLKRFLFEPLTSFTAQRISETIFNGIRRWETRVDIVNIDVQQDYSNYQFTISLTLRIPKLSNSNVSFTGILSQEQFTQTS
jgi:phage baseplate assembly protein W